MAIDFTIGDKVVVNNAYVVVTLAPSTSRIIQSAVGAMGLLSTAVGTVAAVGNFATATQILSFIRVVPDNHSMQAYNGGSGLIIYFESDDQLNNSFELSTAFFPDVNTQRVMNVTGSLIPKGSLVYNTGFNIPAQLATVALASAAAPSTAFFFGILLEDLLPLTGEGACLTQGAYQGVDTTGGTINQILYLSDTPGQFATAAGTTTVIIGRIQVVSLVGTIFIAGEFPLGQGTGGGTAGATGLTGATGVQGATGVAGLGVTGLQGVTGFNGATGIQGNTGIAGLGLTGLIGGTGLGGNDGNTGVQGNTGLALQGVTGLAGIGGTQGTTGVSGDTGLAMQGVTGIAGAGVTGLVGATGVQGTQGVTGIAGTGVTGLVGDTGIQGTQGVTGIAGSGVTGLVGVTGIQGTQGVTGIAGSGVTGLVGDTGIQGLQGATGIAGTGVTGLIGATGIAGTGVTGLQGVTGLAGAGVTGLVGDTGIQGLTGLQGITGIGASVSLQRLNTTVVNMITGGATEVVIYNQGAGLGVVIDSVVVRLTAASAITVVPTVGVGFNAAGADNVFVPVALTGVTAVNDIWTFAATAKAVYAPGTATLLLGIDTGATGTTMLTSVDVIGYRF